MADMKLIRDMAAAMSASPAKPVPYDTVGEVVRVDGDTAWVHIPGGVDETPVRMSVNARIGDSVRVRVGGGTAWLTGNDSAPPTDDEKANEAKETADEALMKIDTLEAINVFADMIQTGKISADYIQGGQLVLGGYNSSNGMLTILAEDGSELLHADYWGLYGRRNDDGVWLPLDANVWMSGNFGITASDDTKVYTSGYLIEPQTLSSRLWDGKIGIFASAGTTPPEGLIPEEYYHETPLLFFTATAKKNSADYPYDVVENMTFAEKFAVYHMSSAPDVEPDGYSDHYGTKVAELDGDDLTLNVNIDMASGATVDGVDVSELANDITTVNMASTTAVASGSNTTLCNTGSLSPGTYILNAMAIFPEQSGGYRRLFFSTTNTGSATTRFARTNVAPVSGADTEVQLTSMFTVSSATTYYLRAYQNSGSSISVATAGIQILKIHA